MFSFTLLHCHSTLDSFYTCEQSQIEKILHINKSGREDLFSWKNLFSCNHLEESNSVTHASVTETEQETYTRSIVAGLVWVVALTGLMTQ